MANVLNPQSLERAANKRIQDAIEAALEREEELAHAQYVGKVIRFDCRWYHSDYPTPVEAPITRVYFYQGDEGGAYYMLFEVVARNPHNGQSTTITRSPGGFEFV